MSATARSCSLSTLALQSWELGPKRQWVCIVPEEDHRTSARPSRPQRADTVGQPGRLVPPSTIPDGSATTGGDGMAVVSAAPCYMSPMHFNQASDALSRPIVRSRTKMPPGSATRRIQPR